MQTRPPDSPPNPFPSPVQSQIFKKPFPHPFNHLPIQPPCRPHPRPYTGGEENVGSNFQVQEGNSGRLYHGRRPCPPRTIPLAPTGHRSAPVACEVTHEREIITSPCRERAKQDKSVQKRTSRAVIRAALTLPRPGSRRPGGTGAQTIAGTGPLRPAHLPHGQSGRPPGRRPRSHHPPLAARRQAVPKTTPPTAQRGPRASLDAPPTRGDPGGQGHVRPDRVRPAHRNRPRSTSPSARAPTATWPTASPTSKRSPPTKRNDPKNVGARHAVPALRPTSAAAREP